MSEYAFPVLDITNTCLECKGTHTVTVDAEAYRKWQTPREEGGLLIQEAFPEMTAVQREQLLFPFLCPTCQAEQYGASDE